jgi:hypothetical protein
LKESLPILYSELDSIYSDAYNNNTPTDGGKTFFNLEFGMKNHIQKHLVKLSEAEDEVCSYFETTCLKGARIYGHVVKQNIVRNIMLNDIQSKIIFGVNDMKMVKGFVKSFPESDKIEIKVTEQIHAPFHVIDTRRSIMVIDNPLFKDGRVASIYAIDKKLANELYEGYRSLWDSAKGL